MKDSSLQSLLQLFFTDRLLKQLGVSPHTVAAYRDAFRLLLQFASERLGHAPSQLRVEDLDASFLGKSSTILKRSAATVRGHETTVSQPYTPFSSTYRSANQHLHCTANVS